MPSGEVSDNLYSLQQNIKIPVSLYSYWQWVLTIFKNLCQFERQKGHNYFNMHFLLFFLHLFYNFNRSTFENMAALECWPSSGKKIHEILTSYTGKIIEQTC